ncbi:MAG: GAF domain-containing protein [Anaerolineales bacterium]|nr:GAF domain-containing protein [Anaerolineales bacterium]
MKAHQATGVDRYAALIDTSARVSRSIASILDLELLLNRTVDLICDEFGFYYSGVFLVDEVGDYAVLTTGHGEAGKAMLDEGHKLHIGGNSMIGAAIANKSGCIALDVGKEAVHFKNPHLPQTRSEMALPLIVADEVIGALTVQSEKEAAFKDEDIIVLQTMADQLAVAIKNARLNNENRSLLEQTKRRAVLLNTANRVGKEVTSELDLDRLLPKMVDTIVDAYGFYYAGIFLVDESGIWAELKAGYGEAGKTMLDRGHKLQVGGDSMIGTCIHQNKARIALDVGEERVHFKNPCLPGTRSEMALPLPFGEKVLGAVTVQSEKEAAFSEDDITSLQTMADLLAVAINNAYTLNALKEAHEELLRTKIYEALTVATTEAIHWIGNKALPISMTVDRMKLDLTDDIPKAESLREDLELIVESADMIMQVKEQLIGQAREQRPRPTLLGDVIHAAARHRGVNNIHIDVSSESAYVLADSTQLARAFGNLLQNSAEANAKTISIKARPAGKNNMVRIIIHDDGAGMTEEVLDTAWTPFYTTKAGHNGLGLPAALHVISQLMGQIKIDSRSGKGTTIEILLPQAFPTRGAVGASPVISLVDDDDIWANFFTGAVKTARRASKPDINADLILIDEFYSGFEAAIEAIHQSGVSRKTIVITAALDVDRMTNLLRSGIDVRLKPYSETEILSLWKE